MSRDDSDELRQQVAALSERLNRLEQLFESLRPDLRTVERAAIPTVPPRLDAAPAASRETLTPPRAAPAAGAPPASASPRPAPHITIPQVDGDLERRIGSHLFNRIGIVAVLIGMAWFLKFAFDNHWIGPLGRVIIGLLVGSGLIGWSEWFRRRDYTAFSYSLKAVGTGVLYLSIWAAYFIYHLMPSGAAFGAMVLITAWNGYMAWAQDAELLAVYALIGGFLTPVLTASHEPHQVLLLTYVLILDLVMFALVGIRPWFRLMIGAFIGTQLLFFAGTEGYSTSDTHGLVVSAIFAGIYFVLFTIAPRRFRAAPAGTRQAWQNHFALTLLPLLNAGLAFIAYYVMTDTPERRWVHPWLAVLFAAFYLALLRVPTVRTEEAGSRATDVVSAMYLGFSVVFLTIAIPLATEGHWLAIGWLVEGAALMWVARRNALTLLRVLGVGALILGGCTVLSLDTNAALRVFFNARFGAYIVAILSYAIVARIAASQDALRDPDAPRVTDLSAFVDWRGIAAVAVIAVNAFALIGVSIEIHTYWAIRQIPQYIYEQFSYSIWWMLYGGVLLTVGLWKRTAFLRWQALLIIVVSIGKVFLVDMSELSQGYRILSFLGLGVLLLGVSFMYQRDWLGLRAGASSESGAAKS